MTFLLLVLMVLVAWLAVEVRRLVKIAATAVALEVQIGAWVKGDYCRTHWQ